MTLKIDWATHEATKYACLNWHYSKAIPVGKLIKIGAWEDDRFIGVVVFSRGANNKIGSPYGLSQTECCELTRVALRNHKCFVSQILAEAIRFLKIKVPNMRLIVSYADIEQGHHGGIYQATNWIYEGKTGGERYMIVNGVKTHTKSLHNRYKNKYSNYTCSVEWLRKYVDPKARVHITVGKHKYLFPLDKTMKKNILKLGKSYPKKGDENG